MKNCIIFLSLIGFVFSCNEMHKPSLKDLSINDINSEHPGKALMEANCYACHSPTANHDNRIAPPMIAVKKHYLREGMTKEDFINDIQEWVQNPTEENAKMFGAVNTFGVMPKQEFPEETIRLISDYLYSSDIIQPKWFENHRNSKKEKCNNQGMQGDHRKKRNKL